MDGSTTFVSSSCCPKPCLHVYLYYTFQQLPLPENIIIITSFFWHVWNGFLQFWYNLISLVISTEQHDMNLETNLQKLPETGYSWLDTEMVLQPFTFIHLFSFDIGWFEETDINQNTSTFNQRPVIIMPWSFCWHRIRIMLR